MTDDLVESEEKDYLCCWVEDRGESEVRDYSFWERYPRFYEDDGIIPESCYPEIWWWEKPE